MTDGYFDNTLNLSNLIHKRKLVVQEQLSQFDCKCNEAPNAPCCLLLTELDLLNRYSDVLDRELWHIRNRQLDMSATAKGMMSDDWKERLKAEWAQLCIRMERLDNFRDAFRKDEIDFVPKWSERLLCDQLRAMRNYRDCLRQYAKLEGIDLDETIYDDSYIWDYAKKLLDGLDLESLTKDPEPIQTLMPREYRRSTELKGDDHHASEH